MMIFKKKLTIYYYKRCSVGVKQTRNLRLIQFLRAEQLFLAIRNPKKRLAYRFYPGGQNHLFKRITTAKGAGFNCLYPGG